MTELEKSPVTDTSAPSPVRRRRRSSSKLRRLRRKLFGTTSLRPVFISILIMVVIAGVSQSVLIADAANKLDSSWESLSRIVNNVGNKPGTELTLNDFNRLQAGVDDLSRGLGRLQSRTRLVAPLARFNADWAVSLDALAAAQSLVAATQDMLAGLEPALFFMVAGDDEDTVVTQISSGERIVELLTIGRGRFLRAADQLAVAREQIDRLDLSSAPPERLLQVEDLRQYLDQVQEINTLLLDAPDLLTAALGFDQTRSYLILSQNSDELRPSGGYISTYGWMTVRNGRILDYSYSPTTATSPFPPPDNLVRELTLPDWWIRYQAPIYAAWDGSWYADFPSTAEMARWYYNNGDNPHAPIDGVIAIDLAGFQHVLEALERVRVPGYEVVITPENFRQVVYDIRAFGQGEDPHKRFVADVFQQIFSDWQTVSRDRDKSAELLGAALRAVQEKHIMIYFPDPQLGAALELLGWSGSQTSAVEHDYLMVADANLGNKSNHSVIRQLTYDVEIQPDGALRSRATLAYDYPAAIAEDDPAVDPEYHGPLDYNSLVQVFAPAGSTLVTTDDASQTVRTAPTATHTRFVTRVEVPYDSGSRFQLAYETPPLVEQIGPYRRYRLLVQKQPGMIGEPVNVQVSLPSNVDVVDTTPEMAASYSLDNLILDFRLQLVTDQWIEVIYSEQ